MKIEQKLANITLPGKVASWNLEVDGTLDYGEIDGTGNAFILCVPRYNRRTKTTTFYHVTVTVRDGYDGWTAKDIAESLLSGAME